MDEQRDGGPAFGHGNPEQGGDPGMPLRDYFAIHADLEGLEFASLADGAAFLGEPAPDSGDDLAVLISFSARVMAKARYIYADAMLSARKAREGE